MSLLTEKLKGLGIAVSAGTLVCGILLLIFSFCVSKINMPHSVIGILSGISLISGALVSGFFMGYYTGHGGIKYGLIGGGCIFLIVFILSLIFARGLGFSALIKLTLCLISGTVGGIIGVNRN